LGTGFTSGWLLSASELLHLDSCPRPHGSGLLPGSLHDPKVALDAPVQGLLPPHSGHHSSRSPASLPLCSGSSPTLASCQSLCPRLRGFDPHGDALRWTGVTRSSARFPLQVSALPWALVTASRAPASRSHPLMTFLCAVFASDGHTRSPPASYRVAGWLLRLRRAVPLEVLEPSECSRIRRGSCANDRRYAIEPPDGPIISQPKFGGKCKRPARNKKNGRVSRA